MPIKPSTPLGVKILLFLIIKKLHPVPSATFPFSSNSNAQLLSPFIFEASILAN